jgi:HD-GYP domain-containing protein (c-di-GMP phosphodiesterase class II)
MKGQTYDERTFNNWIYGAALAMMAFFFVGYIAVGVNIFVSYSPDYLLVALIFFFGALFVLCMVLVQQTMTHTITSKTKETIGSMIDAMEAKDMYTKGHSEHVHDLVGLLYQHLPPEMKHRINPVKLQDAAMLHDIGKIGIPDGILNKPAKLTEEEYDIVKQHPKNGAAILEKTSYRDICDWVKYHHERMDGKGYYGIPASANPIEARIIAVADTFSALYTDRVYRKRFPYSKAIEILHECAGTQLDEQLVEIICSIDPQEIEKATSKM